MPCRSTILILGLSPSGTEKTFLAVVCAIAALEKEEVSRIVLTRPACCGSWRKIGLFA